MHLNPRRDEKEPETKEGAEGMARVRGYQLHPGLPDSAPGQAQCLFSTSIKAAFLVPLGRQDIELGWGPWLGGCQ